METRRSDNIYNNRQLYRPHRGLFTRGIQTLKETWNKFGHVVINKRPSMFSSIALRQGLPECLMTYVFGYRSTSANYQVSSAGRFKRANNETRINAGNGPNQKQVRTGEDWGGEFMTSHGTMTGPLTEATAASITTSSGASVAS